MYNAPEQNTDYNFADIQRRYLMQCWSVQNGYNPIPVIDAEGCWLYTADGRKIFDLRSAHECINLGFKNEIVLDAMRKQMNRVIYVTDDFATEPAADLAKKLAEITPGSSNKKVWFGQSGASAVEAAIKTARLYKYNQVVKKGMGDNSVNVNYPYPYKIISRYRSWHGSSNAAASVSGDPRRWFNEPFVMPGVVFAPDSYCYRCMLNHSYPECNIACADYLETIIEMEGGSSRVAAIILEPVVGSNGIVVPPKEYLHKVREICDRHDILLIADETMTGFGRTGKMFAVEHFGIEPDILIMGKALGMYSPLSAVIFNEKVASSFDDNLFGHGQSYSAHALSCAAALASINILNDVVLAQIEKKGEYLGKKLQEISKNHSSVGEVRGLGLFWTIELVQNKDTKEPLRKFTEKYKTTVVSSIADYLLKEKNIYIPSDKYGIWVVPPLVVTVDEIDFIVDAINDALFIADKEVQK